MVSVALPFRLFFDEAVAETVDGLYRDGKAFFRYRVDDAVFQFLAGPVGKGQAEDFRAFGLFLRYDIGYPCCQDPGLAGSGRGIE